MKNTLLFIYSTNILVRLLTVNMKNCLTPKNQKMRDPILVTLLKMRPHKSHSNRENVVPSSGTSLLACYKNVTPHPPPPSARAAMLRRLSTHEYLYILYYFLHAQREGRVVIFRPHHLHRLSFDTTKFITTSLTSLFAGISD